MGSPDHESSRVEALRGLLEARPEESLEGASRRWLSERGIEPPGEGAEPDDPRVSLFFLVTMAGSEVRPEEVDPAFTAAFDAWWARRPASDDDLGQLPIDASSCLARARVIHEGGARSALAVGDDDAVTLALAHLGLTDLAVVDLDDRLLTRLAEVVPGLETHRVDVLYSSVPEVLRGRFDAVVTDPFRDLDGGLGFLCFAAAALREGGDLYWVDHPAWNFEHAAVRAAMAELGYAVLETHERLHRYPLAVPVEESRRVASALDLDPAWLEALCEHTSAVSHLYLLRRVTRT